MKKVQHYINGQFMDSACGEFFDNYNPATAEIISKVALGREPEVNAAIAMALHLYQSELHDYENTVLTIQKVSRNYSPWSSKIYTLRKTPNKN